MLKQIWIAECDLCGKIERAKAVSGQYNETDYTLPDGWSYAVITKISRYVLNAAQ